MPGQQQQPHSTGDLAVFGNGHRHRRQTIHQDILRKWKSPKGEGCCGINDEVSEKWLDALQREQSVHRSRRCPDAAQQVADQQFPVTDMGRLLFGPG